MYEVAEYEIVDPYVSTTVDGKTNVVTHHSGFAGFTEVTQAPAGVSFDRGYLYTKKSALASLENTALVWNTYNKYSRVSFNLYVDTITDGNEIEFQLLGGATFVSVVDANSNAVDVVYTKNPYVVLQKGKAYSIVVNVNKVAEPKFSFGLDGNNCEAYFYNFSINTTGADKAIITFTGGRDGDDGKLATVTGNVGEKITLPQSPTYPGFTFAGWYTDYECTTKFTQTNFTTDMVVYAKWTVAVDESLTVVSFNVNNKSTSYSAAASIIQENNPHIFGVQEATSLWMNALESRFSGYTAVGEQRGGPILDGNTEHSAIFFRTDMFELVDNNSYGTKWLSNTPDKESKYPGANHYRIMTYAVLERKADGAQFIYVNTHLDNGNDAENEEVRRAQAVILLGEIQKIYAKYGNLPTIVSGDFNTQGVNKKTPSYKAMIDGGFTDSSRVAVEGEVKGTLLVDGNPSGVIFDYIFVSADFADDVQTYKVCDSSSAGSDHFAIASTMIFPKKQ